MAESSRYSFDEFKLYYESTERVTDRRLETNRWNYSICIAILVAIATIARWSLTTATLIWVGLAAIVVLDVMAILFCALWVGQIRDFKKLNNAKFTVLNNMAPQIEFDLAHPGSVGSFCPFDREWKKLNELNALDEVGRSNIVALRSSNIEYFIPKAFAALFVAILVALAIVVTVHWPLATLVDQSTRPSQPGVNRP
jgi:hypothetical protein